MRRTTPASTAPSPGYGTNPYPYQPKIGKILFLFKLAWHSQTSGEASSSY